MAIGLLLMAVYDIIPIINQGLNMKQLYFIFAATAGVVFATGAADAGTNYYNVYRQHGLYQGYTGCRYLGGCNSAPVTITKQEVASQSTRAPNQLTLADPFFQPAAGHVGSLTDIGYAQNTYDFEVVTGTDHWGGVAGDWEASEIFAKEDLSIGLTDDFALMGMLKYAKTDYEMNWEPYTYNAVAYPASTDSMTDNGIAIWGLGAQWKLYEDSQWVTNLGGFYQTSDAADNLMLAGKVGYKATPSTTVYGLANLAWITWEGSSYGNGIISDAGQVAYTVFERDADKSFYIEGGAGVFTKLSDQWSLNLEATLGDYSWHRQLVSKAAIYWQPNDSFALGIYGKTSLWDSADSADDVYMYSWCTGTGTDCYTDAIANSSVTWDPLQPYCMGKTELSNYKEMQVGLQGIIYF